MIKAVSACLAALLLAAPAVADPCLEEIAALFDDGGAMDPFARPPLHQFTQEYDTDGNPTRLNEALFDGPLKTIAGVAAENHFTMAIDRDLWNGPSLDGPWTGVDYQFPQGREEQMRAALAQNQPTAEIPVIIITARGYALGHQDLALGNIKEVLSKPFSPRAVVQKVNELLRQHDRYTDRGQSEAA